jgi:hypothetical protein
MVVFSHAFLVLPSCQLLRHEKCKVGVVAPHGWHFFRMCLRCNSESPNLYYSVVSHRSMLSSIHLLSAWWVQPQFVAYHLDPLEGLRMDTSALLVGNKQKGAAPLSYLGRARRSKGTFFVPCPLACLCCAERHLLQGRRERKASRSRTHPLS